MSQPSPTSPAGTPSPAVAPALLERHTAGLRTYLTGLQKSDPTRVETVVQEVMRAAVAQAELEDDPAVWLFAQGRRRIVGGGQRGDMLSGDTADGMREEEAVPGEDPAIAVHRTFARLTNKQQEVLRLKFQFGFNLEELARITGVSKTGANGLLHSAVARICQATGATLSLGAERGGDVRLTAYALDEMEPPEKKHFVDSVPDGKALLESSDAIRKAGAQLARVLESGAPLPKRRRKKTAGWLSPRGWLIGLGLVAAGGLAWYFGRNSGEAEKVPETTSSTVNGTALELRRSRAEKSEGGAGRKTDLDDTTGSFARNGRSLRPGEAAWERKHFGQGRGQASGGTDASGDPAEAGGETGPLTAAGGARSRGAASGPTGKSDPVAEARGESGPTDAAEPSAPEAAEAAAEPSEPRGATGVSGNTASGDSVTRPPASGDMKPLKPGAPEKPTEMGHPKEESKIPEAHPPPLGIAGMTRQLAKKQWPKPAEVSVAEMMRQVPLEQAPPGIAPEEPFAARVEIAPSPWRPNKHVVRVTLKARDAPVPSRPPANVVFAIDISQSMAGANRLPLVQEGIRLLAQRLRPDDRVAVVTYATHAVATLPSHPLGDGATELRNCLKELEADGQTNGWEGLQLAYATARKSRVEPGLNVVVLCTDGNFNLGETDETVLAAFAAQQAKDGIKLSVFGFGRSDRNDLRLELLATKGGGRSCYVNTREEAERMLAGQIEGLVQTVASGVAVDVKFDPERVEEVERIGGSTDDAAGASAQELLPGRAIEALYEVSLKPDRESPGSVAELGVSYRLPGSAVARQLRFKPEAMVKAWPQAGAGFRSVTAWAEFGRILQAGPASAGSDLDRLEAWVQRMLPDDAGGYRQELLENVAAARLAAEK